MIRILLLERREIDDLKDITGGGPAIGLASDIGGFKKAQDPVSILFDDLCRITTPIAEFDR
jgi:hypothetical protein